MRGGRREGAGRKAVAPEEKRKPFCVTLAPETIDAINEMRKEGVSLGKLMDELIQGYWINGKKM